MNDLQAPQASKQAQMESSYWHLFVPSKAHALTHSLTRSIIHSFVHTHSLLLFPHAPIIALCPFPWFNTTHVPCSFWSSSLCQPSSTALYCIASRLGYSFISNHPEHSHRSLLGFFSPTFSERKLRILS